MYEMIRYLASLSPLSLVMSKQPPFHRAHISKAADVFDYSSGRVITSRGTFTHVIDPDRAHDTVVDHTMDSGGEADPVVVGHLTDTAELSPALEAARLQRVAKHERQWRRWSEDIIPALLKPYMTFLRETDSLREQNRASGSQCCTGCAVGRILEVSCIYFNSAFLLPQCYNHKFIISSSEIEKLRICTCTEPALQLLSRGLFPCAPNLPTLAVDLQMLDFVHDLFVNSAPNLTAWCNTLEGFLNARKFKLSTRVCVYCWLCLF